MAQLLSSDHDLVGAHLSGSNPLARYAPAAACSEREVFCNLRNRHMTCSRPCVSDHWLDSAFCMFLLGHELSVCQKNNADSSYP